MELFTTVAHLQQYLAANASKKIGFVPTMGALHPGHISLIALSKLKADITISSIFVNLNQFNEQADYARYPRTPDQDIDMLRKAGCDAVFLPSHNEIYPTPDTRQFNFGFLEHVMEGACRPGHFNGVAQVVSRLFDIVKPQIAVFGQKDFQQLAIIRAMCKQLKLDIQLIAAPIIREKDGLAMSSRNALLSADERKASVILSQTLFSIQNQIKTEQIPILQLKNQAINQIENNKLIKVEYLEFVDSESLQSVDNWNQSNNIFVCVAARLGQIRLIDNCELTRSVQ